MWRGQRIEMGFQEKVKSVIHSFVMQTLLYENYMCHLKKRRRKKLVRTCTYMYLFVFHFKVVRFSLCIFLNLEKKLCILKVLYLNFHHCGQIWIAYNEFSMISLFFCKIQWWGKEGNDWLHKEKCQRNCTRCV